MHTKKMASVDEISVDDELSRQHFRLTPTEFIQDFTELIVDEITTIIREVINNIESLPPEIEKDRLLKDCDDVHQVLLERVTVASEELAPIITEVFTIPKNVGLPLSWPTRNFTDGEIKTLEREVQELKIQNEKELREIKVMEAKMKILEMLGPVYKKIDAADPILQECLGNVAENKEMEKLDNDLQEMFPNIRDTIKIRLVARKFKIVDEEGDT